MVDLRQNSIFEMHEKITCQQCKELFAEFDTPALLVDEKRIGSISNQPENGVKQETNIYRSRHVAVITSPEIYVNTVLAFFNDAVDPFDPYPQQLFHTDLCLKRYCYDTLPSTAYTPYQELSTCQGLNSFLFFWTLIQELVPDGIIRSEISPRRCSTTDKTIVYTVGFKFEGTYLGFEDGPDLLMKDIPDISRLFWILKYRYHFHYAKASIHSHVIRDHTYVTMNQSFPNPVREEEIAQIGSMILFVDKETSRIFRMDWYLEH